MEWIECGRDSTRRGPRDVERQRPARERLCPRSDRVAQSRLRRRGLLVRILLALEQQNRHGAEDARDRRQRRQHRASADAGARVIEREARAQTAHGAAQRAKSSAAPEVPAAKAVRDEIAHPGRPGVVAGDAEQRAGRGHGEKHGTLLRLRERQPGQQSQQEGHLAGDPDRPEGGAPAAVHLRQPRRGDLDQLRGEGQRAEDADEHRRQVEIQRPGSDGAAARASAYQLGCDAFRGREAERAAKRVTWLILLQAKEPSHGPSGGTQGCCGAECAYAIGRAAALPPAPPQRPLVHSSL